MAQNLDLEEWQKKQKNKKIYSSKARMDKKITTHDKTVDVNENNQKHNRYKQQKTYIPSTGPIANDKISPEHLKNQYIRAMENDEIIKIIRSKNFVDTFSLFTHNNIYLIIGIIALAFIAFSFPNSNILSIINKIPFILFIIFTFGFIFHYMSNLKNGYYPIVFGRKQFFYSELKTDNHVILYDDIEYFTFIKKNSGETSTKYLSFKLKNPIAPSDITAMMKINMALPKFIQSEDLDSDHILLECMGFDENELIENFSQHIEYHAPTKLSNWQYLHPHKTEPYP